MLKWIQEKTESLISDVLAERQWKNAFNRVFGKGRHPEMDPEAWEELCRLDRQHFPGRLMPALVEFLGSQSTSSYDRSLIGSYLRLVPSVEARIGDVIRRLTDPRVNPDEGSRFWAWDLVFRHRLHIGHFGRLIEPLLNHEPHSITLRLVSQMLLSTPDNPATTVVELPPLQALLRDRLQKLEKEHSRATGLGLTMQQETFSALWGIRVALSHHAPDENLPADFHRAVRFYHSGDALATMLPLIHKVPPEMTNRMEIAAVDGLLRRLHTHPESRERTLARSLCADLSRQISPEVMMKYLLAGLSTRYYPMTRVTAALLHDMLFPKDYSPLKPSPFPRLSLQAQQDAEKKLWALLARDFLERPDGMSKAHHELLVSLENPARGATLSDLIRKGLALNPVPAGLPDQLAELIPRIRTSPERCELWEAMARQLPEAPAIGPALTALTRRLPLRDLVNHINHHSPALPPEAAALVFNQLLPSVREVPLTHESPSRVALRQLWDQIPPHIQAGFRQRYPEVTLLVADPQPGSNRESAFGFILPDHPRRDPSPFLALPPTPGQTPHMRLGEIWERFLPIAAADLEKWGETLYEVQRAVPVGELCRRLGQGRLQRNFGHHVHLWELVAMELHTRRHTVSTSQQHEQLDKTINLLPSSGPVPADRAAGQSTLQANRPASQLPGLGSVEAVPHNTRITSPLPATPTQPLHRPRGMNLGRP